MDAKVTGRTLTFSEATKKRNPGLFNVPIGLCPERPESNQRSQSKDSSMEQGEASVCYHIVFTVFRRHLLDDHDNARSALKPLCDLVGQSLGFDDDSDERLTFEYHQLKTKGAIGTLIVISKL